MAELVSPIAEDSKPQLGSIANNFFNRSSKIGMLKVVVRIPLLPEVGLIVLGLVIPRDSPGHV